MQSFRQPRPRITQKKTRRASKVLRAAKRSCALFVPYSDPTTRARAKGNASSNVKVVGARKRAGLHQAWGKGKRKPPRVLHRGDEAKTNFVCGGGKPRNSKG